MRSSRSTWWTRPSRTCAWRGQKRITSRIGESVLDSHCDYDHRLHAAITVNPNALKEAEQLDRERGGQKCEDRCTAYQSL